MDILSDLSNAALSTAIESNQIGFLEYFGRFAQVTITYRPDMVRLLSESGPFPIFNRIVRAQFGSNDDIPACIETTTAPYRTRKLPLSWTVGPVTTPANLEPVMNVSGAAW